MKEKFSQQNGKLIGLMQKWICKHFGTFCKQNVRKNVFLQGKAQPRCISCKKRKKGFPDAEHFAGKNAFLHWGTGK